MIVVDASALLALLQDEPGAEVVTRALSTGVMSVANLAEVLAKAVDRGLDLTRQHLLIASLGIRFEPVTNDDAFASAALRRLEEPDGRVLSLGDRLCLALAWRLDVPVLTADRAWNSVDHGVEVPQVR